MTSMALLHLKRAAIRMETAVRVQPEMVFMAASAVLILVRVEMAVIMSTILKTAIWAIWEIFLEIFSEICSMAKAAVALADRAEVLTVRAFIARVTLEVLAEEVHRQKEVIFTQR